MKTGITLIDGTQRNREHPTLFQIPIDLNEKPRSKPEIASRSPLRTRRIALANPAWPPNASGSVSTRVSAETLEGVITDDSAASEYYGLHYGDRISFEECHVLDIETIEQQAAAEILGKKFVTISAGSLENKLPDEPRIRCELDSQTTLHIGRTPDAVHVLILLRRIPLEAPASMDRTSYVKAYRTMARRLGLIFEGVAHSDSTDFCSLLIHLSADVTGSELIRRVRDTVVMVHMETNDRLASGSHGPPVPGTAGSAIQPSTAETNRHR